VRREHPRRILRELHGYGVRLRNLADSRLVAGPLTYEQDGLATRHNSDFMKEPRFARSYSRGKATGSWGDADIHWRAHVACWAAQRALCLEGDFVECGVNRGGLALTVMTYVDFADLAEERTFYLLDTFHGLPDKYISEEERRAGIRPGGYDECYESVRETFGSFPNVAIIRGAVPETLSLVPTEKVAYLSIDMNSAAPEIAAAEFFWDKLDSGGVMLLDDYGWPGHGVQKRAFDEFAMRKRVPLLSLPTGQGLILKQ
jgi:O-methyltransferase